MSLTISVVVVRRSGEDASSLRERLEVYLRSIGETYEILLAEEAPGGVRRAVSETTADIVAVTPVTAPPVECLGDAIGLVRRNAADAVFVGRRGLSRRMRALKRLLVPLLPDAGCGMLVFSSAAAKLASGESRLDGYRWELEMAYLLNRYGFHVEVIEADSVPRSGPGGVGSLLAAMRIRLFDRHLAYRAARRCPVCFSPDVWSCGQVPGNVVRECKRCKSRYLNRLWEVDEAEPVHRVPGSHDEPTVATHATHSADARLKTSVRRLAGLRGHLPSRSRILEIGIRDASFGVLAAGEYEYVGIDRAAPAAKVARAHGLEAYCASLSNFVNTGPAFDAVVIYHVLESMVDPHDAVARVKEFLKPGGMLFLTAYDTEGLLYLLTEESMIDRHFRNHLILYSRSGLVELLERSGFEIVSVSPDFVYRDHKFLRHWLAGRPAALAAPARALLTILPDPLLVSSGSLTIVARRRSGHPLNRRGLRSAEATHVR